VLSHLASGLCTVIPDVDIRRPGAVRAAPILARIASDNVTCLEGSPAFLMRLVESAQTQGRTFTGVRHVFTGGAPVFPAHLDAIQRMTPRAQVTAVYGSTEAEPIAHVRHDELTASDRESMRQGGGLLTGLPVPEIEVRILPDRWGTPIGPFPQAAFDAERLTLETHATSTVGDASVGEIVVSGGHVLPGYWQGEGDAESKFQVMGADGTTETVWHRTGDAGRFDDAGRLWLLGRCSARIQDARGLLYPFAVECAVHDHPAVRQAAFLQVDGRRVLAIALQRPMVAGELDALRAQVAWAHVDAVRVLDKLPVDPRHNAKIDYVALQRQLAAKPAKSD
jgi:acyl-CoA synthetase (AMP-forming)/AMP-acid ligase II